jgi:ATP-binding protein involved in chromosome partitioning
MSASLQERVTDALSRIRNNRLGANLIDAEMVKDIATTVDGRVRLTLFLTADDDATVVREVRQSLQQIPGVTDIDNQLLSDVDDTAAAGAAGHALRRNYLVLDGDRRSTAAA